MGCGSGSSRYCRESNASTGIRDASAWRTGRCCAGSCSCSTPGSCGGGRPAPGGPGRDRQQAPPDCRSARIPLAVTLTGGDRNDVTRLIPLVEAVPPIRGKRGQPLQRPRHLYADRGYDHETYRDQVRWFQDHPTHRATRHRARLRPRRTPLGRRGRDRAAALVPPPTHPLGAPRRHPPALHHPRLRQHLLEAAEHHTPRRPVARAPYPGSRAPGQRRDGIMAGWLFRERLPLSSTGRGF